VTAVATIPGIRAVARGDPKIADLDDGDALWAFVLDLVDKMVDPNRFGNLTESAQTYLGAHLMSQALNDPGGRGPLSAESVGGVSQSWTLPYLNNYSVLGATQYGMMYREIVARRVTPAIAVDPAD
jgi:Protein of unknown function (DUF4054)